MYAKISYSAICAAFDGDDEIGNYCDPINNNASPQGVSEDVLKKLLDYEDLVDGVFRTLENKGEEIGFVYYFDNILVSFGVNKKHRTKEYLKKLFAEMVEWMGEDFITFMWDRNQRAIKWFERCGMEKERFDSDNVIKLRYKPCL
jgi:RimJ/RimL family protein N-acetyltransferase